MKSYNGFMDDDNLKIPNNKRARVVLIRSKLSSQNQTLWAVIESENIIGLDPGSVISAQDIVNLHAIPELDVILKDISALEKLAFQL